MTSLSNVYRLNNHQEEKQKIISLKPIEKRQPPQEIGELESLSDNKSAQLIAEAEKHIEEAKQKAEQLINDAKNEIAHEKEQLEEHKATVLQQAKEDGYKEGYQAGKIDANNQYESLIEQAVAIVDETKTAYKNKLLEAEKDVLLVAMSAAEKITKLQLKKDESSFVNIVKEAVEEVIEQPEISIHVHPDSFDLIKAYQRELESIIPETSNLYIYPNKDLREYGCHIESPFGVIDCSVDTKLELLKNELLKLLEGVEADELSQGH